MIHPVFWLSWFVVYSVMVTFIALLVSLVSKFVIIKSISFGVIFLICEIFGFTLIMFAFMVTALFSKRKAAGAFGGIITMLMALTYYLQVRGDMITALEPDPESDFQLFGDSGSGLGSN